MTEDRSEAEKGPNAWAQAVAALVVVGGLGGGLWVLQGVDEQDAGGRGPAACSSSKATRAIGASKHVSGSQLCTALNRSDLPALLGTPSEQAETAGGDESSVKLAGGTEIATPEATVTLKTYSVKLSASYDDLSVGQTADLLAGGRKRTVLGHSAVLYSDRTIAISFRGDGKADTGPGGIARTLVVAQDAKDGGGSYEIAIWRQDAVMPDDAALLRVAEKVLPAIPGWVSG